MTKYDPDKHDRRSIRLKGYDYAQAGLYLVTICAQNRECRFGEIVNGEMVLNDAGRMAKSVWEALTDSFPNVELDAFVIMPNHFHGIVALASTPTDGPRPALGHVIGAFKSITTNAYITGVRQEGWPSFDRRVWQRNYYERIIRNERELNALRQYIFDNPANWADDRENPNRMPPTQT